MNVKHLFIYFLCLFLSFACQNHDAEKNKILKKAAQTHIEAMQLGNQLRNEIAEVSQFLQKSLPKQKQFLDTLEQIHQELKQWEKEMVEVPGFEHQETDAHHHHEKTVEVTPDEMLLIQKETEKKIHLLLYRMQKLKNVLEKDGFKSDKNIKK